jgi:hypothetical protein
MPNGLQYPARDVSFVQINLAAGSTDFSVLSLGETVVLYSILLSNACDVDHIVSFSSFPATSAVFPTYLPKQGGTVFYNLIGTEYSLEDSQNLYATVDAGGTGFVYLTLGYKKVV